MNVHKINISLFKPAIITLAIFNFISIIILSVTCLQFTKHRSGIVAGALSTNNVCSTKPINSATLIRTYRLLDLTDGFNVSTTKDGGYLLMGDTLPATGMAAAKPFIIKTDAKGNLYWTRWFSSPSMALGDMSSSHRGRLAVETTDNNIITAIDVLDFVDENTKELYGDILITKLNKYGTQIWSLMLGDYSIDRPQKIWALPDGGALILGRFLKTGYGNDVADTDTVPRYSVLIKINKNGQVQSVKKLPWDALDMQRLPDGSFIALSNIAVSTVASSENTLGSEVTPHDLPTIIKLDSNLNVQWAKSLEMISSAINSPTLNADGTIATNKTTIRLTGGDFRQIQLAPDGGFIAFGFANLLINQGLSGNSKINLTELNKRPFVAAKVDSQGNYQWTKKLNADLTAGLSANDLHIVKTADNNFVIMQDAARDSDWATKYSVVNSALALAWANTIELVKTDADFNPIWIKKIDVEKDLTGFDLAPTSDNGVVIAGNLLTTKTHLVMGSPEPYKEAALIKVDVNGKVSGCAAVTDYTNAILEDQSQYLIMQNMTVAGAEDIKLNINKKVKEKVTAKKNTARHICLYKKIAVTPVCTYLTTDPAALSPVAKTWALINYENTTAVAVEGEKNISINNELLPILNEIFTNQVKVKDNMKSMWLTYIFPRLVTRADVEAVQKKYEALGYKIDESDGANLWVSKVGLTLHLTFSIQSSLTGKLEVLF